MKTITVSSISSYSALCKDNDLITNPASEKHEVIFMNEKDEEKWNRKRNCLVAVVVLLAIFLVLFAIIVNVSSVRGKKVQQSIRKLNKCDTNVSYLDLGKTDNSITFFTPPSKICFNISRSGIYYLSLSIKLNCSITKSQQVSIMLKNKTLQNPAILINKRICGTHKPAIFEQETFPAKEYDKVCLESYICLDRYSGNFIMLQWYEDYA